MREQFEIDVSDGVYPPSEDTYLLLDAVDIMPDDVVVEVGCGAGLGAVIAASRARLVLAVDISREAVKNTRRNLQKNGLERTSEVFQSDLLSAISAENRFSMILFNPPYLPADGNNTELDHMHIGGQEGGELTQRLIIEASHRLLDGGRLFLVVSSLANTNAIMKTLESNGFKTERLAEMFLFFERIQILKGTFRGHKETVL
jgi:release factor glutamine methyltransferase